MKSSLRRYRLLVALLAATALAGCGRKAPETPAQVDAPAAASAEQAAPAEAAEPASPDIAAAPSAETRASDAAALAADVPAPGPEAAGSAAAPDLAYEAWFKRHGLDLNNPQMLDADPDGDGATNRDEFTADTNPHDGNSRPGVHASLRLKEYSEVNVPVVLESVSGDTARLRRTDDGGAVETVKAGQLLRGLPFRVEDFRDRRGSVDKDGQRTDGSRVTLVDPVTKSRTVLVKDMPARSAGSSAVLTSPDGATTLTVRQGETFEWPAEPGTHYEVKDLRADQVVLQHVETGKMWTVPKQ